MKSNWLENFNIKVNYSLKNLTWFKIGGNAEYFYTPTSISDLQNLLKQVPKDIDINILGAGSNILIKDTGIRGLVLKLNHLNHIEINNNYINVECGASNLSLANFAYNNQIGGLEFLSGIPGTIGGGVAMNAGAFGKEFKDIVNTVTFVNREGNLVVVNNKQLNFKYRENNLGQFAIFVMCSINKQTDTKENISLKMNNIKNLRHQNQPIKVLTGGSTFANPDGFKAWELLDKVGMRGYIIGGACFSSKHCNFIINFNNASFQDVFKLIELAKQKVYEKFKITLKTEIKIL